MLAGISDAAPDNLARTAADRARERRQRPAWLARIRHGTAPVRGGRGPIPVLVATLAVVALIVVGAPLLGRLSTGPGASPSATPSPSATAAETPEASPTEAPASVGPSGPPALAGHVARQIGLEHVPTAVGFA